MIVLDTHAWIWLSVAPEKISARARGALDAADQLAVSVMSWLELGMLEARSRIRLDHPVDEWARRSVQMHELEALDVDVGVAARAAHLFGGGYQSDPADVLIAATALEYGVPIVSRDRSFDQITDLQVIW